MDQVPHRLLFAQLSRSYRGIEMYTSGVYFGSLEQSLAEIVSSIDSRFVIVYDERLTQHQLDVAAILERLSKRSTSYALVSGEKAKELSTLADLWDFLGKESITRSDVLIAIGGGSTTDLVGFAAATWMRGIRYINIPTTLLAMVDASVGGKTAINSSFGKNLIGSFHMPHAVFIDQRFLQTLDSTEISNGLAEVVKCGFIQDPYILKLLESQTRNYDELIQRSVRVKQHFVGDDPKESKQGVREILNYGHTLGHAIERVLNYEMSHGQAIAIGMQFAAELSFALGFIKKDLVERHKVALEGIGLQTTISNVSWNEVLPIMKRDKKNLTGKHRFILLKDLALAEVVDGIDEAILEETYAKVCL